MPICLIHTLVVIDTIVQLPRFDASVFMHSAHTNQSGMREQKLLRRTLWLKPVLPQREAKEGVCRLFRSRVGSNLRDTAIRSQYKAVRSATSALAANISAEDQMVQSCPEASPMKWHQAHTTWFFETFVLRPFLKDYKPFREEFRWLFNSYYNSLGEEIPEKSLRSAFSRPTLDEVIAFRAHVDEGMDRFLASGVDEEAARRTVLGLHHEQQHQELALTDIKHAFFSNPLHPSYHRGPLLRRE